MWLLDFPSLVVVILSAIYLGVVGIYGQPVVIWDQDFSRTIFVVAGASGLWQLFRQRFI